MFDLYPSRQKPSEFTRATLRQEIEAWVVTVKDAAETLPAVDTPAANKELFAFHQKALTDLATLLIDYTEQQHHPYRDIIYRSKGTLAAAGTAKEQAKQCAKLFAGYSRKPQTYDQVISSLELRFLLTQLTSLWEWLNGA